MNVGELVYLDGKGGVRGTPTPNNTAPVGRVQMRGHDMATCMWTTRVALNPLAGMSGVVVEFKETDEQRQARMLEESQFRRTNVEIHKANECGIRGYMKPFQPIVAKTQFLPIGSMDDAQWAQMSDRINVAIAKSFAVPPEWLTGKKETNMSERVTLKHGPQELTGRIQSINMNIDRDSATVELREVSTKVEQVKPQPAPVMVQKLEHEVFWNQQSVLKTFDLRKALKRYNELVHAAELLQSAGSTSGIAHLKSGSILAPK